MQDLTNCCNVKNTTGFFLGPKYLTTYFSSSTTFLLDFHIKQTYINLKISLCKINKGAYSIISTLHGQNKWPPKTCENINFQRHRLRRHEVHTNPALINTSCSRTPSGNLKVGKTSEEYSHTLILSFNPHLRFVFIHTMQHDCNQVLFWTQILDYKLWLDHLSSSDFWHCNSSLWTTFFSSAKWYLPYRLFWRLHKLIIVMYLTQHLAQDKSIHISPCITL